MTFSPVSRRTFLKGLSMTGLVGCSAFLPSVSKAGSVPETMTETRMLMGTFVSITLSDNSTQRMQEALEQVFPFMESQISLFDRHQASTPVGILNAQGSLKDAPHELTSLLNRAQMFSKLSGNAFNLTVQPLVDLYRRHQNPAGLMQLSEGELSEARQLVRADGLHIDGNAVSLAHAGMGITLDGIAKGHIADLASAYLVGLGLSNHLINAGGDIVASGKKAPGKAWTVAVSDPSAPSKVWSGQRPLSLENAAVATSGSYQTVYDASGEHHHLISPQAGKSPQQLVSVTVRAKTALEADALATTLAVMPPKEGLSLLAALPDRECLMITASGGSLKSSGWSKA